MSLSGTRDFFELVKAIGESKSKQEEDRIISEEVVYLKKKIPETGVSKKKMKELVIRALYVEMLGQDASFAYIKAVELCASSNIVQKRVGYLASALCFSPEHEFRFMLINQIQRDMNSSNHLETCAALSAVCKIVTADMIPAVINDVTKLLKHDMEIVRKKAVCAMHRLFQMDNTSIQDHMDKIRRVLCDKDPSVMGASLILMHAMIVVDPLPFKDLVSSFTSILKQIVEHRLPREYDYHRIPAPWIQMHLLKIMALLGRGDQAASEQMYEVLVDVMRRADTGINVGYAIVYESVRTVTTIYPNPLLLDAAATAISRFIRSDSHNLKYIGIKGLATIVKDHPRYAADHQMAVIDCLEDPDETLKRKTLDLLFRMTNSVNVEFIVDKLLSFLAAATDDHFRTDLVGRITQCAERFAPSNSWFVSTIVRVFELAGDKVKMSVAQTLMQLIAEGSDSDDYENEETGERMSCDDEIRTSAVEDFLHLLEKPKIPDVLAQAMAWVLGEYGYLSHSKSLEEIMVMLGDLCKQSKDPATRCYAVTAVMKLVAQSGVCPPSIQKLITDISKSSSLEVVQRCHEFQCLLGSGIMTDVLPVDASCEDIEVDENLPFLDRFVQNALDNGAVPYSPPSYLDNDDDHQVSAGITTSGFKIAAYERPTLPVAAQNSLSMSAGGTGAPEAAAQSAPGATDAGMLGLPAAGAGAGSSLTLGRGVAQVWGRKAAEPPPPPSPQPAPTSTTPAKEEAATHSPAATPAPVTAASPVPNQPHVPTEKEKMAAALFGGFGGGAAGSTTSSSAGRRGSAAATAATRRSSSGATPAAAGKPSTPPVRSASVASPTTTAPASSANMFDLLDMAPAPSSQSTPVVTPLASHAGPDLFGDMLVPAAKTACDSSSSSPAPSGAAPAPPANVFDAFADMTIDDKGAPPAQSGPTGPAYNPIRLSTAEFGGKWGQTPSESRRVFRLSPASHNLQGFVNALQGERGISHIESIPTTNEAIFATTVGASIASPQGPLGSLLLIHTKLLPQKGECVITVKSSNKLLGDELVQMLSSRV